MIGDRFLLLEQLGKKPTSFCFPVQLSREVVLPLAIVATHDAIEVERSILENEINLLQAYPNPFKEKVRVSFTLTQTEASEVKLYDNQGREIATLFRREAKAN